MYGNFGGDVTVKTSLPAQTITDALQQVLTDLWGKSGKNRVYWSISQAEGVVQIDGTPREAGVVMINVSGDNATLSPLEEEIPALCRRITAIDGMSVDEVCIDVHCEDDSTNTYTWVDGRVYNTYEGNSAPVGDEAIDPEQATGRRVLTSVDQALDLIDQGVNSGLIGVEQRDLINLGIHLCRFLDGQAGTEADVLHEFSDVEDDTLVAAIRRGPEIPPRTTATT